MAVQQDWMEKDFYEVLGVDPSASAKEITRAYRKLARELHPDTHPDDPAAEERFKDVSQAYDIVGDASKRKEYDDFRQMLAQGPPPGQGRGEAAGAGRTGSWTTFDEGVDLDDLFGSFFGGAGGARRGWANVPVRGADYEASLELGFEEAVRGVTQSLMLGEHGSVSVRIPAGVDDGQVIRIPGKGGAAPEGGEAGDLYVHVHVRPHAVFGRSGRDLTVTVPVTYPQAVLGANVKVPTLDGSTVTVKVPAGSKPGRVLRVRGRGVKTAKGSGDLLATIELVVPTGLTDEQREAVEHLAEVF